MAPFEKPVATWGGLYAESGQTLQASFSAGWLAGKPDYPLLYRSQILQVNTRLKALAEISTIHSLAQRCDLNFFANPNPLTLNI